LQTQAGCCSHFKFEYQQPSMNAHYLRTIFNLLQIEWRWCE